MHKDEPLKLSYKYEYDISSCKSTIRHACDFRVNSL